MILEELEKIKNGALEQIKKIKDPKTLENLKTKYLGRKSQLSAVLRDLKKLSDQEKPKIGALANEIKNELQEAFTNLEKHLHNLDAAPSGEFIDLTMPGQSGHYGHLHPLSQVQYEIEDIFSSLGFSILDGPELEADYYNFSALNMPAAHPSRDTQDTFFVEDWLAEKSNGKLDDKLRLVLRTQTSAMQVRTMEKYGAPLKAIFPGRVFRYEATDARHETTFSQIEGLMIDKDISISHLIAFLKIMLKGIFKREVGVRLRPGYFPFVEPGFEVDVECLICSGQGCPVCKQTGWVEMIGAGLVHPNVLKAGGLDPKEWSGLAFGVGSTRLSMLKYGINDIRLMNCGDLRFINQF
jgi:phenylalanyl-tRNA synthetase alpha chain